MTAGGIRCLIHPLCAMIMGIFMSANITALAAPEIIAHRGASFEAPENTLPALTRGWELAPACELDIRLSKDREVVVLHDISAKRTAGLDRQISELTLPEILQLDAGLWKGKKWRGTKIPTLSEVLAALPPGKKLFVEMKAGPEILVPLKNVLENAQAAHGQIILISFDYATLLQAKKLMPWFEAYWLCSHMQDPVSGQFPEIEKLISLAKSARFDGLNLDENYPIDSVLMAKVRKAGLKLYVWTVDDPGLADKLSQTGVDGITTNRPDLLQAPATARP